VARTFRIWWPATLLLLLAALLGAAYLYLRPQYKEPKQLVSLLPQSDAVLVFADVQTLRMAGFLKTLSTAGNLEEADYRQFVSETGFAYERDLDAAALAFVPNQVFAVLRGRFNWPQLEQYAARHGGSCHKSYCQVPGSKPDRWVSFFPVQSQVMALAVSSDPKAAYNLLPRRDAPQNPTPSYPAWARIPKRVLDHPEVLPPAAQVFATALSAASEVDLGVQGSTASETAFNIRLTAQCPSATEAAAVRDHLSRLTVMFRSLLKQSSQTGAGNEGLETLLASGSFQLIGNGVEGEWRVSKTLIDSLSR
jgi:hypothetical protein